MPNAQEVLDWIKWDKERKANMTNEEWFCSLSTEEKVKALLDLRERIRRKMRGEIGSENKFYKGDYYREWLKEEHEPLKNDEK